MYAGGQIYDNDGAGPNSIESAQSFTVGSTGYFDHFNLLIGGSQAYPVTLKIRNVTAGVVDASNALASVNLISPQWGSPFYSVVTIDVSAFNVFATAGSVFAISLEATVNGTSTFGGWAGTSNAYAGGRAWGRNTRTGAWGNNIGVGTGDLYFQTYMSDTPTGPVGTPEPAALGLLGLGIAGLAYRRRRTA